MRELLAFVFYSSRGGARLGLAVAAVAVAGLAAGGANAALLVVINRSIQGAAAGRAALVWQFVGLCLLLLVVRLGSELLLTRIASATLFRVRVDIARRILATPLRPLEQLGGHRLLAGLVDDVPPITTALSRLPTISMNVAIVAGCLIYLGWSSRPLLVAVLAALVLGAGVYTLFLRLAIRFLERRREHLNRLFAHFRAVTGGIKELQLHAGRRRAFIEDHLEPTAGACHRNSVTGNAFFSFGATWGQLLFFVVIGAILFGSPSWLGLDREVLTGAAICLLYMLPSLETTLNLLPAFGQANVAKRKIDELQLSLAAPSGRGDGPTVPSRLRPGWWLEMRGVAFTYPGTDPGERFRLGPIDLRLEAGEVVFLIGGNGSGKTSLAKLLTGLYTPDAGQIVCDGRSITEESREWYRQQFSVIFSDFFLFDALLGLDGSDLDSRARRHLARLQLAHKVRIEEGRLSTTDLSQGQRKRLALLTAFIEDRPIYLFDEWAADQDVQFREAFYREILPELRGLGKAVVVISHDDRYYSVADRIVKLDYGSIESVETAAASWPAAGRRVAPVAR